LSLLSVSAFGAYLHYYKNGNSLFYENQNSDEFPEDSFEQYMQFIAKFGKTDMKNLDEFNQKFEIFRRNYKRIVEHNAIKDSGFSLEINKFADLSDEEFISKYTGAIVPKHKTDKMKNWTVPTE